MYHVLEYIACVRRQKHPTHFKQSFKGKPFSFFQNLSSDLRQCQCWELTQQHSIQNTHKPHRTLYQTHMDAVTKKAHTHKFPICAVCSCSSHVSASQQVAVIAEWGVNVSYEDMTGFISSVPDRRLIGTILFYCLATELTKPNHGMALKLHMDIYCCS